MTQSLLSSGSNLLFMYVDLMFFWYVIMITINWKQFIDFISCLYNWSETSRYY